MRIIVDADACPSLNEIALIALKNNLECHFFCDYNHNLNHDNAFIHYISEGYQMVDIAISNFLIKDDILITQDYGLACIALSKDATAINPNGIIYNSNNIDSLLEQKFINQKLRNQKIRTIRAKKRTSKLNDLFLIRLQELIVIQKLHKE